MTRNVDQLRSIQTFEELIPFLEDDLDWPFPHGSQEYEFDDLTFEYTPDELGLEDEYAAKIKRIHQLRPLVTGQPWGIFFVEFENKKLPIVVLRRILSHLVLKQRKSANPADRARWNAGDLLFISAFAEEGTLQREIAFAHFHQDPGDQPTLRVLGWDGGDTPLKLEHVSQILKHRLSWPSNPSDHAAWRKQWAGAFRYSIGQQIQTADMLARELARVARNIRDAAMKLMKVESSRGPLRRMHDAFRIALIHDLTPEGFADTYAQTITYGLLTAAISRTDMSAGAAGTHVLAEDIHNMVPITNPFLKEMLESFLKVGGRSNSQQPGLDFDELGVQEVVEMLRSSEIDLPAVLEDFGNKNPGEDPVIRFYEDFLKAYNKELKVKRGVFYTPQPVVSFIVRSVHELLQTEFGLPDGLASTITWGEMADKASAEGRPFAIPDASSRNQHFVVILDPATGTATFLVEVIDLIFRTMTIKWKAERLTPAQQRDEWNRYVPAHLLPRLFGFELMMAPYAIAHMKIGLKLGETGYSFGTEERVRIFLTNALEPAQDFSDRLAFDIPALAHEARTVNVIKKNQHFAVIVGNPPYATLSQNKGEYIDDMMERYKVTVRSEEIQIQALSNDYVKFLCLSTSILKSTSPFVIGMITDNSYLDGPLFRDMRADLLATFQSLSIVNLNGNSRKRAMLEIDENVFDIQQGVAVLIAHGPSLEKRRLVAYGDLRGTRLEKYHMLSSIGLNQSRMIALGPTPPLNLLCPRNDDETSIWWSATPLPMVFAGGKRSGRPLPFNGAALATRHDRLAIAFTREELIDNLRQFFDKKNTREDIDRLFGLCSTAHFSFQKARSELSLDQAIECIRPILYRPFDWRFVVYHPLMIGEPRPEVMGHLIPNRLGLLTTRRVTGRPFDNVFVTRGLVEYKAATHDRNTQVFPLYLLNAKKATKEKFLWSEELGEQLTPNLGPKWQADWTAATNSNDAGDAFKYIYALLHSPSYRALFRERLSEDYARILLPRTPGLADMLKIRGAKLISLHLFDEPPRMTDTNDRDQLEGMIPAQMTFSQGTIWLDRFKERGFQDVDPAVWNFHIGGYQVCEKWLKDRKGRALARRDIEHYQRMLATVSETITVMSEIDEAIDQHGGWPAAFA